MDTVVVACGTYYEHDIELSWGVTLRSETGAPDCVIIDASSPGYGGGIYMRWDCHPTITGCVISGNTADYKGGGIICRQGSNATISGCVIANNTAGTRGGGLWCHLDADPVLDSCTFYGNAGGDWVGCIAGQGGINDNFSGDPLFCDPDSLDLRLEAGSPCLDAPGCGQVGAFGDTCEVSAVPGDETGRVTFGLLANRPNPSALATEIVFSLSEPARATLAIHDATGRRITVLADRGYEPGVHRVVWDGKDSSGHPVSPGVYFCLFEAGDRFANQKIVLVK